MSDLVEPTVSYKPNNNQNNEISINEINTTALNIDSIETKLEEQEMQDKIEPMKANYDNKAFELEDIDINQKSSNFNRIDRPGSMMSIKSTTSKSSRTSVNCTSGRVRCPNLRMKRFYSYKEDAGFHKAAEEIKQIILPDKDGNFIGNWLLVEISTWDLHREKVIVLTEKTLFVVTYDFIKLKIYDYKRINLIDLRKVNFGQLKYPTSSMMGDYSYGAVKIVYGNDDLSFFQRWNPLSSNIPILMLISHHILYNDKEKESAIYNCDEFLASLEFALSKLPETASLEFKEEPVEIHNYANFLAVLYNQNWFGFQLDRNGISF